MKVQTEKNKNIKSCAKKKRYEERFVKCKFCDQTMIDKIILYHMRNVHPEEFKNSPFHCEICNQNFLTARSLRSHMGLKHKNILPPPSEHYECDIDGKVFSLKNRLLHHMNVHLPKVKCQICGKMLKVLSIDDHMNETHATVNKFQCKICRKSFKSKDLLGSHVKIHDKKFQCKICELKIASKTRLKSHMKWIHENPGSHECEICNQKFNFKRSLDVHQRIHDKYRSKKFKCPRCGYAADLKCRIENHQQVHEKSDRKIAEMKDPQKCEQCLAVFKDLSSLKSHKRAAHPKVLLQCDLCGKYIKTKSTLTEHINMHIRKRAKLLNMDQ